MLDDDLPMAVDVITDMVTSARLDEGELETELGCFFDRNPALDVPPAAGACH